MTDDALTDTTRPARTTPSPSSLSLARGFVRFNQLAGLVVPGLTRDLRRAPTVGRICRDPQLARGFDRLNQLVGRVVPGLTRDLRTALTVGRTCQDSRSSVRVGGVADRAIGIWCRDRSDAFGLYAESVCGSCQ